MKAEELLRSVLSSPRGCVVAGAGCGKTEQIVAATELGDARRLILTHTHAGVAALRLRLASRCVPAASFQVATIAGWSLKFASAYPIRSGLSSADDGMSEGWDAIYGAVQCLIRSGAISSVLRASYSGVLVDEYQDCTLPQHNVICALADVLPTCVYGDPLQGIFGFGSQRVVKWEDDVLSAFPQLGALEVPWRWINSGSEELARWLGDEVRPALVAGHDLKLATAPAAVRFQELPRDPAEQTAAVTGCCKSVLGRGGDDRVVVIGDSRNESRRANIARQLAKAGFRNIEAVEGRTLLKAARQMDATQGRERLECLVDFLAKCVVGIQKTPFLRGVDSALCGKRAGRKMFGSILDEAVRAVADGRLTSLLAVVDGLCGLEGARPFRPELLSLMTGALRLQANSGECSLEESIWQLQVKLRHGGRATPRRAVGSTLLVKGLEFEHAVIVASEGMSRQNWYVALTRASRSVVVMSASDVVRCQES